MYPTAVRNAQLVNTVHSMMGAKSYLDWKEHKEEVSFNLTAAIFRVLPPVGKVYVGGAANHQLQFASVKRVEEADVDHFVEAPGQENVKKHYRVYISPAGQASTALKKTYTLENW